jgi:ElaB/YqjD/DUF883 family membrane-anchored ribosome-binding protein
MQAMKSSKTFAKLSHDVEELLEELNGEHGPEVQELRNRVEDTLDAAKRAVARQRNTTSFRIGQYASAVDGYITDYPRLAFVTGALIFGSIGYLAGATARPRH